MKNEIYKPVWPTIRELSALIRELKPTIMDDYSAYPDCDGTPSMLLTIGADGESRDGWSWQTGDNSYTGGAYHYPYWGVVAITRRSDSREVARDIIRGLDSAYSY